MAKGIQLMLETPSDTVKDDLSSFLEGFGFRFSIPEFMITTKREDSETVIYSIVGPHAAYETLEKAVMQREGYHLQSAKTFLDSPQTFRNSLSNT